MIIDKAGIYDGISEKDYHADPCPEPSASSSILKVLLKKSPLHAFMQHPRLNTAFATENKKAFDIGRAAHEMLLGVGQGIVEIDAGDYCTKAAKEARDAAYLDGKTPLLKHQHEEVSTMVKFAKRQLTVNGEIGELFLENCFSEQTAVWQENGVWCRSRLDRITSQRQVIFDFKTTGQSAHPEEFMRTIINLGYDLSAAHYIKGEEEINGHTPYYVFIVQETAPPYALSVIQLSQPFLDIGKMKRARAMAYFKTCLKSGKWPAYPNKILHLDPPAWELHKWIDEDGNQLSTTHEETQAILKAVDEMQKPKGMKSVYE